MLDLLVHCHDFVEFSSGPTYAVGLAGALGSSLTGLYVAPQLQSPPAWRGQSALAAEYLAYAHEELVRARLAQHEFARWAARAGAHSTHWQLAVGDTAEALIAAGNWADLVVVEHRARVPEDSLDNIGRTLLSGVPCIVVPENETRARPAWERIAIAWNGTAGAVRAVHAALPLLRQAGEILLLSLPSAPHRSDRNCEPEFSIERYLERHELKAKWHSIETNQQPVDQALLVESARLAIDLLVMGAFGTTRFRAEHPHGITARVLQQSALPVFACH